MTAWRREGRRAAADAGAGPRAATPRLVMPLGQPVEFDRLVRQARRLTLPHALVVEGARGVGKSTAMQWLAAALLCPSDLDPDQPCGVCRTCNRVAAGLHPDVHLVDRARDEDDKDEHDKSFYVVKIDQIRAVQEALARHAVEGRARVVRIEDADTMEEPAQNALLKTLEEPGPATFLLLEVGCPEKLLPTVRSRVQRYRVVPLAAAVLRQEFQRREPTAGTTATGRLAVARGSLGAALELGTERAVQIQQVVLEVLAPSKGLRPIAAAGAVLEGCRSRPEQFEAARLFLWLLRSELRARRDALAADAAASYPDPSAEPWTTWLELTLVAERDLDWMIPPEQVLTACLLRFG